MSQPPTVGQRFTTAMEILKRAYPRDAHLLSDETQLVYHRALADLSIEQIERAVELAVRARSVPFLPSPGELRDLVCGSLDEQAAAAWSLVYRHRSSGGYRPIAFDDPRIHAAVHALGGWPEVHLLAFRGTESVDVAVKRKQFIEAYKGALLRGVPADTPKALCADLSPDPALGGPLAIGAHTEPAAFPVEHEPKALPPRAEIEAPPEVRQLVEAIANRPVPTVPRRREVIDRPVRVEPTAAEKAEHERRKQEALARFEAHGAKEPA